jgi:hypothetical protein
MMGDADFRKQNRLRCVDGHRARGGVTVNRMSDEVTRLRQRVIDTALRGPGHTTTAEREAAFANQGERARALVDTITRNAWKVTDDDIAAAKQAGLGEDQIFELAVCAALGQATRQLDAALAALDTATSNKAKEPA